MNKASARYAVLVVNFNTARFVARAVDSLLKCATSEDYMVIVVDNASTDADRALLKRILHPKVQLVWLDRNNGFAAGYNTAARLAEESVKPAFLVIMNPDIEVVQRGSIEALINCIEEQAVAGVQPLIHSYRLPGSASQQPAIRRIPSVWDLVIAESIVLRYVFRDRFNSYLMRDSEPHGTNTRFYVPSGAFFVMRAGEFFEIGGFDEGTFLYAEELILGKKLERRKREFAFEPNVTVRHFQGAATGFERWKPNRRMYCHRRDSQMYYLRHYADGNWLQRFSLYVAMEFGYLVRLVAWLFRGFRQTT
jgi:GT2 family glycosyltransferase